MDALQEHDAWLEELARTNPFGPHDRLGTAHYIDDDARLRGAAAVRVGRSFGLGRAVEAGLNVRGPIGAPDGELPTFRLRTYTLEAPFGGTVGTEHLDIECHGSFITHVDALNHLGTDTWYSGWPRDGASGPSIVDFADRGIVTRGVLADIPVVRGTPWVTVDEPVQAAEIDAVLREGDVRFEPGDALLLYMGRDRYEAGGQMIAPSEYRPESFHAARKPGAGATVAHWLVDHSAAALLWDFLDAQLPGTEPPACVHRLIWARGLIVVDNCDFSAAVPAMREQGRGVALVAVSPLRVPGATGSAVNPLVII
jgi:kynurenine formamidase